MRDIGGLKGNNANKAPEYCSQFRLGDGIGLSYRPASLCSLAGLYDNPMSKSTLSPQSGIMNLATGFFLSKLYLPILWFALNNKHAFFLVQVRCMGDSGYVNGANAFFSCRLYPFFSQPTRHCLAPTCHLSNHK